MKWGIDCWVNTRGVAGVVVRSSLNDIVMTEVSVSGWLALIMERVVRALSVRVDRVDGVAARIPWRESVDEMVLSRALRKTSSSPSSSSSSANSATSTSSFCRGVAPSS